MGGNGGHLAAFILDLVDAMAQKTGGCRSDWQQSILHEAMRVPFFPVLVHRSYCPELGLQSPMTVLSRIIALALDWNTLSFQRGEGGEGGPQGSDEQMLDSVLWFPFL